MTLYETAPYENLILTGPMGTGKSAVGRAVAQRLKGDFFDLENEILTREGQSADDIRALFGEARLKALETTTIHDLTLHRHAVIVVGGTAVLEEVNRARLTDSGVLLCLTCALDEILHRIYAARGAWFHNPANRGVMLSRLRRELRMTKLDLPQIDTTRLSVAQAADAVITFWIEHARV